MKRKDISHISLFIVLVCVAFSITFSSRGHAEMTYEAKLFNAVNRGDVKQLQEILPPSEGKPSPQLLKTALNRALGSAINQGKTEIVKLLLEKGANAENPLLLFNAVNKGNPEVVKLLLEHGAKVNSKVHQTITRKNQPTVERWVTPLEVATASGNGAMIKLLRQHGARRK